MSLVRCLKCDFMRLFHNFRFIKYILFMGIFEFIIFVTDDSISVDLPVLHYVAIQMYYHIFLLVLPVAFLVFGTCLIEDKEEYYYRQEYMRVSLGRYVLSKSLVNAFASVISVVLSLLLAVLLLGTVKDWNTNIEAVSSIFGNNEVSSLYASGNFIDHILCILLIGLEFGMLSGLLSSISFLISSFINDRIFAAVMTFVSSMVIQYIWVVIDKRGLAFLGYFIMPTHNNNMGSHWLAKDFLMMLIAYLTSTLLTLLVLKRRTRFE